MTLLAALYRTLTSRIANVQARNKFMNKLLVYADFHFIPATELLGTLTYDRVRGNEVFSFSYNPHWLNQYGHIRLGGDLGTFPGLQYAPSNSIFGCFADLIIQHCPDTEKQLEQLFRRVAFNICVGNADDHFRNHGFLLTSKGWILSPAYDMNPSLSKDQCLMISETTNEASLTALSEASDAYFLPKERALAIIAEVRRGVSRWTSLAKRLHMSATEVKFFEGRFNLFL